MLSLGAELTVEHVQQAKAQLATALAGWQEGALTVDCEHVAEVDGAGLQMLTLLAMELRDRGGSLRLSACRPAVRERLCAVALDNWFEFDTAESL